MPRCRRRLPCCRRHLPRCQRSPGGGGLHCCGLATDNQPVRCPAVGSAETPPWLPLEMAAPGEKSPPRAPWQAWDFAAPRPGPLSARGSRHFSPIPRPASLCSALLASSAKQCTGRPSRATALGLQCCRERRGSRGTLRGRALGPPSAKKSRHLALCAAHAAQPAPAGVPSSGCASWPAWARNVARRGAATAVVGRRAAP